MRGEKQMPWSESEPQLLFFFFEVSAFSVFRVRLGFWFLSLWGGRLLNDWLHASQELHFLHLKPSDCVECASAIDGADLFRNRPGKRDTCISLYPTRTYRPTSRLGFGYLLILAPNRKNSLLSERYSYSIAISLQLTSHFRFGD